MIDNSFRIAALREGVHEKPHPAGDRPLRILPNVKPHRPQEPPPQSIRPLTGIF